MPDDRSERPTPFWRELLRALPLETETVWFVFVSVLDLLMTYLMLWEGPFQEANPVARFFLDHWGPKGLVWFKMGMVAVVVVIAQVIARKSVTTARRLLYFATAVVAAVVVYSLALYLRHGPA